MLVTILMLGLALACAAIGIWAIRRSNGTGDRSASGSGRLGGSPAAELERQPVTELQSRNFEPAVPDFSPFAAGSPRPAPTDHATVGSRVFLDFDGKLGRVHIERPEVVIGRHTQDDIRINDVRVSRHHARLIAKRDGGFEIHNLTSVRPEPNPMQINGETREHADIVDGDVVTLGGVSFVFRQAA